jgi:hypothetical protein
VRFEAIDYARLAPALRFQPPGSCRDHDRASALKTSGIVEAVISKPIQGEAFRAGWTAFIVSARPELDGDKHDSSPPITQVHTSPRTASQRIAPLVSEWLAELKDIERRRRSTGTGKMEWLALGWTIHSLEV